MPTADKIVAELEVDIRAYQAGLIEAANSIQKFSQVVQKHAKETQIFVEKSQRGQALVTEKTAYEI